jgi:hypothetical protein
MYRNNFGVVAISNAAQLAIALKELSSSAD